MYESAAGVKGVFRWLSPKGMDANEYAAGGPDYPFKLRRVPRASSAWAGPWTLIELLLPGGGFRRVAQLPAASGALYYAEDMLGSSRVMVQANGTLCYDADFMLFGWEKTPYTSTCAQNYKFEGKERDTETGNDDFGARYYSWRFGRWLSSDWSSVPVAVPYANLTNPQTLNLYAMVGDDPESFADLDGHGPPGSNNVTDGLAALDAVLDCAQGGSDCGALLELVGMDDYGAGTAPPITYASVNPPPPGSTTPPPPPTAQNQSTAPVPNTQSQQIPGTPFTITNFTGALFTNGEYGVAIGATANCSGCSGWVQTITKTGAGDTWGREFVDNGNTATNHYYTNPIYGGGNYFSDMPTAPNGGSFKGIVWAGSADVQNKTFTTQAAFAYRFSVSKSGKLSGMAPRPATNTERAHSLATIRADYPRWTIN